jgi:hypothetical protein
VLDWGLTICPQSGRAVLILRHSERCRTDAAHTRKIAATGAVGRSANFPIYMLRHQLGPDAGGEIHMFIGPKPSRRLLCRNFDQPKLLTCGYILMK